MATAPVTRATLIQRVARLANTSGYADPSTGGEISQQVDISLGKMHNFLVGLYEDYFTKTYNIGIVSGQDTYNLPPADFMKLRQVFYVDVSGYRWPLRRLEVSDLTNVPISINYSAIPLGYVMMNNQIVMFPKPANTQINQLLLFYIPEYVPAVGDNDPIEYAIAFGWDEWVVYDVVAYIRQKAMLPVEDIIAERNRLEARLVHQAKQRNTGDPPRVRDTGWNNNQPYTRWGQFAIKVLTAGLISTIIMYTLSTGDVHGRKTRDFSRTAVATST